MEDSLNNPFSKEPQFQELKKYQKEINALETTWKLNYEQSRYLYQYEKLVKDFADKKIKCFSEKVIPIEKKDIEIICTNQGAH